MEPTHKEYGARAAGAAPLSRVLVANRGEIAVRVIRACKDLGITSVAVHSEPDAHAMHVRLADESVLLPGASATETYLNIDLIVRVMKDTGADAVHPGYGFLAESADFARAVEAAGGVFIGPDADAITVMGSKVSARSAAVEAGVPLTPGSDGPITTPDEIRDFAGRHGYPVAVKASFGGGGRGMRVIRDDGSVVESLNAAQREAQAYFGHPEVYVEKYLERPRHVEVQVFGDQHGNVVALSTRDCTVQRRHQKLVEEAPCAVISPTTDDAMCSAAVALARSVGYVGAGTLEFLVEDDAFYFLEMNTRLQVEHPVTEAITGLDLVAEQLRVAAGFPLSFAQSDVTARGHALELRINAEDPADLVFRPVPGAIEKLTPPSGFGTRWDGGYQTGDSVSEYYDGLIGKLVVHATDRPSAIARAQRALDELEVRGIPTTALAHRAILSHPTFAADQHTTTWLENDGDLRAQLTVPSTPPEELPEVSEAEDVTDGRGRSTVTVGGRTYWVPQVSQTEGGPGAAAPGDFGSAPAAGNNRRRASGMTGSADGVVRAPMQGTIVALSAEVGDIVSESDVVCVLEAMKMENPVTAGRAGRVTRVDVVVGGGVSPGDTIVVIE
jgi:acetyl-CoA/propionyl-CoA carboxylase biotin carboxyl carrier protein